MWASYLSQSLSNQDLILSEPNVNPVGIQNHIAALMQIILSPSWLRDDTNAYKISISTEFFNILWQLVIPSLSTFYYKELNKCLKKMSLWHNYLHRVFGLPSNPSIRANLDEVGRRFQYDLKTKSKTFIFKNCPFLNMLCSLLLSHLPQCEGTIWSS